MFLFAFTVFKNRVVFVFLQTPVMKVGLPAEQVKKKKRLNNNEKSIICVPELSCGHQPISFPLYERSAPLTHTHIYSSRSPDGLSRSSETPDVAPFMWIPLRRLTFFLELTNMQFFAFNLLYLLSFFPSLFDVYIPSPSNPEM